MEAENQKYAPWRSDLLPSIIIGVLMITGILANFLLPIYLKDTLGFSGAQIGAIFSLQALAGMLAVLPTGLGNDKISSRTLVITALVLLATGFFLMGRVQAFVLFAAVAFLYHIANHVFRMSLDSQVLKTDFGNNTGLRIGNYQAFRFAGFGIGAVLSGYLIKAFDYPTTMAIFAFVCLALIIPAYALPSTQMGKVRLSDYKADFFNPRMLMIMIWLLLFGSHWGAEFTCYALFIKKELGLPIEMVGWYMSGEFVAIFIVALYVGRRLKGSNWLVPATVTGLVFSGVGGIGMVFKPVWLSFLFRAIHGAGDGLIFLVFYVGIAKLFKVERLGGNAGLLNLATMVGLILGSLVYGPIGEKYGYEIPFWSSGVLILLLILPLFFISPKQTRLKD